MIALKRRKLSSICIISFGLLFSTLSFGQDTSKSDALEKELEVIFRQNGFNPKGWLSGIMPDLFNGPNEEQKLVTLERLKAAFSKTKKIRSFENIELLFINTRGSPTESKSEKDGTVSLFVPVNAPAEMLIGLLSSDPKSEPEYQKFLVEQEKRVSEALKNEYGRWYPYLQAGKEIGCGQNLASVTTSGAQSALGKAGKSLGLSANITVDRVSYNKGDVNDKGEYSEYLYVYLKSPPPKQVQIKKEYAASGLTRISIEVGSPQKPDSWWSNLLADMFLTPNCVYDWGRVWTYTKDGNAEKKVTLDFNGNESKLYYENRDAFPLRTIYSSCRIQDYTSDSIDEVVKQAERIDRVLVTILDSGVDYNHPGVAYKVARNPNGSPKGWDYQDNDDLPYDNEFSIMGKLFNSRNHGTHVAGIASKGSDDIAILPIRYPKSSTDKFVDAVNLAHQEGSRVVNISLGSEDIKYWEPLKKAMQDHPDMLFVIAAGNDEKGKGEGNIDQFPKYPAAFDLPNMIVVAAVDETGKSLADFSNYGAQKVHVAAPGVSVMSFLPEGQTGKLSGTSMATPFVTNLAVKILTVNPKLSVKQIREIIFKSIDPIPALKDKVMYGGVINEKNALAMAKDYK